MASSTSPSPPLPKRVRTPVQSLVDQFNDIHLSSTCRQAGFVGGFRAGPKSSRTGGRNDGIDKPLPPTPSDACDHPNNVPPFFRADHRVRSKSHARRQKSQSSGSQVVPPTKTMPIPMLQMPSPDQSLTLVHAQSPPLRRNAFPSLHMPQPDNNSSITTPSPPTTPRANAPIRASSTLSKPSSCSDSHNSIQCHGTTKAGKRCTRVIKAPPPVSIFAPPSSEPVQQFCFQHVKKELTQTGFYSHKEGGGWVVFSDWISKYLHPDTQAALRVEMEKPPSSKDKPGYIYAYEIRDAMPNNMDIKVGRAINLVTRLNQWARQCTSKEVILRGCWPESVAQDDRTNGTSLVRGVINAGEKSPWCHRLERLIHLELADLAVHAPYLEPGFPNANAKAEVSSSSSAPSTPRRSPQPSKRRTPVKPCIDCGTIHREIFSFQRVQKGKYKNAEWEKLIQPVIAKWGRFVDEYV